jgi:hypothetical protein
VVIDGSGNAVAGAAGVIVSGPGGVNLQPDVVADPLASIRDRFWPKTVALWLVIALVLTTLSVQLVSPTRRSHPRLPGFMRRPSRRT